MQMTAIKRRDFLKSCLAIPAALSQPRRLITASPAPAYENEYEYDSKGLPTRVLGGTGIRIPVMVFGCGSRFCTVSDPNTSTAMLHHALNNGLFYWDTAHDYVYNGISSEQRLGLVLKDRREEVFLATKVGDRTYDGAMRHCEESLKRLQTDRVDLYQIHLIRSQEDVDHICAPDGVLKAVRKLKEEKVTRFIGLTGHLHADAMQVLLEREAFDTLLIALNHYKDHTGDFEKAAIPAAAARDMGILAMKVIRPQETVAGVVPEDLIRYALSLEHVHAAVIGMDSMEVLKKNLKLVRNFTQMSAAAIHMMDRRLQPFYAGNQLEWMNPSYTDGISGAIP